MIIREVRGFVRQGRIAEFHERVARALFLLNTQDGLMDVHVGRQSEPEGERFLFVSVWHDLESIYRWVGRTDLMFVPAATGGYDDLMDECDVQHWSACERDANNRLVVAFADEEIAASAISQPLE